MVCTILAIHTQKWVHTPDEDIQSILKLSIKWKNHSSLIHYAYNGNTCLLAPMGCMQSGPLY